MNKSLTATKTVNPLHFEDLEPHRFEDLVRQLIYDYRGWASIEAVGRLGADDGIDIRATERIVMDEGEDETDDDVEGVASIDRVWIIQCKRERVITPAKIGSIVTNDLTQQSQPPYAYILTAACDFSKKSRDTFRQVALSFGVQECHLWGKAELEDLLFLPKNDHLLFAYFGLSLRVQRRSLKTDVRAHLALKRKLVKELGGMRERPSATVLIRDVRDESYPFLGETSAEEFLKRPRWRYWKFEGYHPQKGLIFVKRRHLAYADWDTEQWDVLPQYDEAYPYHPEIYGIEYEDLAALPTLDRERYYVFWDTAVPKANKAHLVERALVPYERIIALDELGDSVHEGPHLLIECRVNSDPFSDWSSPILESDNHYASHKLRAEPLKQINFFPKNIPEYIPEPYQSSIDADGGPKPPPNRL